MEDKLILLAQVILLVITGILSYRRAPFQNSTDAANAVQKFQETTVSVQAELREVKKEYKEMKDLLANAHLEVTLGIQIGERPEVLGYKWTAKEPSEAA